MKILYGVQGTGNGHISRASAMFHEFAAHPDLEVTWLLSGRDSKLGCGDVPSFDWRPGLTFATENGRVNVLKTLRCNDIFRFLRDIDTLDLGGYDLLVTDYEPVLAHAARKRGLPTVGLGHQYAFRYPIPMRGANPFVKGLMDRFAPATRSVGLHWHHFDHPILPPIVDLPDTGLLPAVDPHKVIVYLPFENPADIERLCSQWLDYRFYIYHPQVEHGDHGNLRWRPISRVHFKRDLLSAASVITNSGFELISECLKLGKRILTKPLQGQMEQLSNAQALAQLGYATVHDQLTPAGVLRWLEGAGNPAALVLYPNVAKALAGWIADGARATEEDLATSLWNDTVVQDTQRSAA